LTGNAGLLAVSELADRLRVGSSVDRAVGPIKKRDRGHSAGDLLLGIAAAQLAGEDFLVGLDRMRADAAGQRIAPVPGLCSTTAAGLARRMEPAQWHAAETGLAWVAERAVALLPAERAATVCEETVTIDLDATDVEVYGRHKRGVAYNYAGQRCGRPHVATWAETEVPLAADLLSGDQDPRPGAAGLLERALAGLPGRARTAGRIALRADAGYFAGDLARAAAAHGIDFAIGAKRIAPLWRLLDGIAENAWAEAIDMPEAQVAVACYAPADWPGRTRLLIRRVRLDPSQVSADPRSRRRRTLHPDQRVLPLAELGCAEAIYAYSFLLTNLEVSSPDEARAVEHWYRHRTSIENVFLLRGSALWWRRDLRVCAAQKLMEPTLPLQQVWCKWQVGFSPVGVGGVDAGHEFAVGGACGGEVVVAFGELESEVGCLRFEVGDLLVEGVDVGRGAEPGGAPSVLAQRLGEAFFEVLDAGVQPVGAFVGGEQVGLQ
jgi:hypothetical protein